MESVVDKNVSVNVSLLLNLRAVINIASQRGAFRPEEYKAIGTVYEQLQSVLPKSEPETETSSQDNNENKTI
jgi:hypothetical protein